MATVTQTNYAYVGRRRVKTKRVEGFWDGLAPNVVEAGAVQLRILAEEARELILDKLFAATPDSTGDGRVGQVTVRRPRRTRTRSDIPYAARRAYLHTPLADVTIIKKLRNDQDGRRLIATGAYVESIQVSKHRDPRAGVFYILSPGSDRHPDSRLPMNVLARIHEYGSAAAGVPRRPHWRPVRRNLIQRARALGRQAQAEALRRTFRQAR